MSITTKPEEMQPVDVKSEEMQSVEVKSEETQPQPKPEMQFKPEMQSEMQLKPPALKQKRFTLKPRKRFPKKEIDQMLLTLKPSKRLALMPSKRFALKPLRQKRSASETMISELKRCKSEPPKPITLPVMIQTTYVNTSQIYLLESYILRRRELFSH